MTNMANNVVSLADWKADHSVTQTAPIIRVVGRIPYWRRLMAIKIIQILIAAILAWTFVILAGWGIIQVFDL